MQGGQKSNVYLRSIDVSSVAERYLSGLFKNLVNPLNVNTSAVNNKVSNILTINENNIAKSHECDFGTGKTFACLGSKSYKITPNSNVNCMYCLDVVNKYNPIGIPVKRCEIESQIVYNMVDIFCSISCCIAELKQRLHMCIYSQSMVYLNEICRLCLKSISNVNEICAQDYRLLQIFNGPLTWDQFHKKTVYLKYIPENVHFLPSTEYIEQDT